MPGGIIATASETIDLSFPDFWIASPAARNDGAFANDGAQGRFDVTVGQEAPLIFPAAHGPLAIDREGKASCETFRPQEKVGTSILLWYFPPDKITLPPVGAPTASFSCPMNP